MGLFVNENPTTAKEMYELGEAYRYGKGLLQDQKKAVYWFNKASELGNANATGALAGYYAHGWGGLPKDKKLAESYRARRDEEITMAAAEGDAEGMLGLAFLYKYGSFSVKKDTDKASYWHHKAFEQFVKDAERGDAYAFYRLAECDFYHYFSIDQRKDAVYWYAKAAERGSADGQNMLGWSYCNGTHGVQKNEEKAIYWFTKAAEQGHAESARWLGDFYSEKKNHEKASYWYTKGAEQGDTKAKYHLGINYYFGNGVPKDVAKAKHWIALAAEPEVEAYMFGDTAKKALERLNKGKSPI